jgi:hypothetical protein
MARASSGNGSEEAWGALRAPQQQVSHQLQKPITTTIYSSFLSLPVGGRGRNSQSQRYCEVPKHVPSTLSKLCNVDAIDFTCSLIDIIPWLQWKLAVALQ